MAAISHLGENSAHVMLVLAAAPLFLFRFSTAILAADNFPSCEKRRLENFVEHEQLLLSFLRTKIQEGMYSLTSTLAPPFGLGRIPSLAQCMLTTRRSSISSMMAFPFFS